MNSKKDDDSRKQIEIPSFMEQRSVPRATSREEDNFDSDAFIREINSSLAQQINTNENNSQKAGKKMKKKKKRSRIYKAPLLLLTLLLVIFTAMLFTDTGKKMILNLAGNYIYGIVNYQPTNGADSYDELDETDIPEHVINILLLGLEEYKGAKNTDSMIVATMNTKDHSLKLTSLMRDLYVDIPGHNKNKLNAAYSLGGTDLLFQTVKVNFDLELDGYCIVNYETFEQIVDMIDGVEITLTEDEAYYLNHTNYISDKSNRNVVAGKQLMNGNQALGYCRVRKVSTGTENNDFGRTQRQRIVLDAIFNRLKSKNVFQLVSLLNKVMNQVKIDTNITNKEFNTYLQEAVSLKVKEMKSFRLPTDGSYVDARVPIGSRNVLVLEPKDWSVTKQELHDFIYGKEPSDNVESSDPAAAQ